MYFTSFSQHQNPGKGKEHGEKKPNPSVTGQVAGPSEPSVTGQVPGASVNDSVGGQKGGPSKTDGLVVSTTAQ